MDTSHDSTLPLYIGAGEIQKLLYKDIPVVTFEQIAAVHGVSIKTVQSSFREHKTRFVNGKHFYLIDFAESQLLAGQGIKVSPQGLTVFTEAGYLLLVKPMRDDTAWQVQEKMIEAYFRVKTLEEVLTEGGMLVRMAMAYERIEAQQKKDQLALMQAQKDVIELQKDQLALQADVIEAKTNALLAAQSMQWVTIRQYVQMYRMQHQMPPSVQRRYATWLTTYCLERHAAMYKAATADKDWPFEKTYCVAMIQDTVDGWLRRYRGSDQQDLETTS